MDMLAKLDPLEVEEFHVIGLNTKNAVVMKKLISRGALNSSVVTP